MGKAFVYETLRHSMVAPLGLPHGCYGGTVDINGYKIYPGTQIFINYVAISRKEKDALEFNIDRWLDENGEFSSKYQREAFLLFGYSTRDCIGKTIAMQELFAVFAYFILQYVMYNDEMPDKITHSFGINRSIEPQIPIYFRKRLP